MGNYQQHVIFGFIVGLAVGLVGFSLSGMNVIYCVLAGMLAVVASLLPDLDHDQSTPLKEIFNLAAAIIPFIIVTKYVEPENDVAVYLTVVFGASYLFIKLVVSYLFKRLTVHRGMFHSVPAMVIVGELVYLTYFENTAKVKMFLAIAAGVGFLSHLFLDEISSVDFSGGRIKTTKYAGSALAFWSKSVIATAFTYSVMVGLFVFIILRTKGFISLL